MILQSRSSNLSIQLRRERFNDDNIVRAVRLDPPELGRCCRCQQQRMLHWFVEDLEGCWGYVCRQCGEALLEKLRQRGDAET
jgi:hypothetical protein